MLFGLSIGLAVALVVYLRSGQPSVSVRTAAPEAQQAEVPATDEDRKSPEPVANTAGNTNESPAEGDKSAEPAYSFFDDLSKSEVVIDDNEFDFGTPNDAPRVVLIQAGAFRNIEDADARQASLALLGFESNIDTAIVADELWFRVLIGPLTERGEINGTIRRLQSQGIETVLRTVTN
jgi:cell division protein FtsN